MKARRMIWSCRHRRAVLLAGTALLALMPTAWTARAAVESPPEPAVLDNHADAVLVTGLVQLSPRPSGRELQRLTAVKKVLEARRAGRNDLVGRQIVPLSRREAIHQGLEHNLQLAIGRVNPDRARETLNEVKAVFDPIFDFDIGYSYAASFKRTKTGLVKVKTVSVNGSKDQIEFAIPTNNPCATLSFIEGSQFSQQPAIVALEGYNNTGYGCASNKNITDTITANPGNTNGHPTQKITYTIGLTQQLPWGGQLSLTDQTVQQKIWYRANASFDDNQFTTNFTGALTMPVPFTKGFGKDNPNNANIRTQEALRDRSEWELKALINQTVRDVDLALLEVSRAADALKNADDNRGLIGRLRDRTDRLFAQGLSTRFQKAQFDNEYAKAQIRVESALQAYVNASVSLARLIGNPDAISASDLYLPFAVGDELTAEAPFKLDEALAAAKKNRPDYFVAGINRSVAEIALALAQNQALPDVQISANIVSAQNGSVIGYGNVFRSHANITNPDSLTQTYGVTYTYPWLNRSAEAEAERAEINRQSAEVDVRATDNQVRQEITAGLATLQAARAQVRYSSQQEKGLGAAVASLQRRLDVGVVSEDELITTTSQWLDAQQAVVNARINAKEAETVLYYSRGTINGDLASRTSQSVAEQRRLQLLAGTGHLTHFAPGGRATETAATESRQLSR